jgi:hypothetical protein
MQVIFLNSWLYSVACLTMKNQWILLEKLIGWRVSRVIASWGRLYKTLNHFFNHYFVVK